MVNSTLTLDEPGQPTLDQFTASDGYPFFFRRFAARGTVHGRIVVLHGIQSHGGWYPRSCAKLAEAGFEVYFLDRRGSGQNSRQRGDMPGFRRVLDDCAEFIRALPPDGLPKFLIGISWGGKLAVALPCRHPGLIDGMALICPGIAARVRPSLTTQLRIGLARLFRPTKLFPIPLNDPELFTASVERRQFIRDDPLALRYATARLLFGSRALDIYLRRARKKATIPTLLLLAEKDRIIDNAKTRAFVDKFPSSDKEVIEYSGAEHTLEFEAEGHPWLEDLVGWFEKRCR